MADYAHNETDKRIAELEKRLSEEYRQAYKETKDKLEKYLSDFKRKDEKKRQEVVNGTLSEKDYKTWRRNQMLTGQRWADMVDTLAKDMNNVNVIAAQIVSGEMPEAFSLNANYSAYEIENGYRQNYGFTLYDRDTVDRLVSENPDLLPEPSVDIPADLRWNKQKIVSNITQAVLQGKSIPDIAKSMETVVGMNKASAVRNARTAMTGAQNAGRQQAYERAAAMGIKLQKEWIATLDGRTRHSHGMADGQKVDINGMFSVGGCKMRYPGDVQNGTAAEIYNCRCTMCTVEPPEIMQGEEARMTYSEWVKTKEGQEATGGKFAEKPLDNGSGSGIIEETKKNINKYIGQPITQTDNQHIREWYYANVSDIPNQINPNLPLDEQAKQAFELRNKYKRQARAAMTDTKTAEMLEKKRPAPTFDELVESKMKRKGMTREEAIKDILKTASKTNEDVNKEFGL